MAEKVIVFNFSTGLPENIEIAYQSPPLGLGTRITAFSASNATTSSKWYRAYIYNSAGVPSKAIIPLKVIVRDTTDFGTPLVNQFIPPGGTLRIETSDADSISFYVSGIEVTV